MTSHKLFTNIKSISITLVPQLIAVATITTIFKGPYNPQFYTV